MEKTGQQSKKLRGVIFYNIKNKKAFTLIEMIISVTILAILASIGFLSISNYTGQARDSVVKADLATVSEALKLNQITEGSFPVPDELKSEKVEILGLSGWNEGVLGENSKRELNSLSKIPLDPKDSSNYKYFLSENGKFYYLEGKLEDGEKIFATNYIIEPAEEKCQDGFFKNSSGDCVENHLPRFVSATGDIPIYTDIQIFLTINTADDDGDEVTISSPNLPEGLRIEGKNIVGQLSQAGNYAFDLFLSDGKQTFILPINPFIVVEIPRAIGGCSNNMAFGSQYYDRNAWILINQSNGLPDYNGNLGFYIKNYKNYKASEFLALINGKFQRGEYMQMNFGGIPCFIDNNDIWTP